MTDSAPAPWYRQTHWRILAALVVGLVYGVVAALAGWSRFTADWITPFGTIFLRLLLLIAVPLVLGSLITGVASLADLRKLSRIGSRTIVIYLATTFVALVIGLALVNVMGLVVHDQDVALAADLVAEYAFDQLRVALLRVALDVAERFPHPLPSLRCIASRRSVEVLWRAAGPAASPVDRAWRFANTPRAPRTAN